VSGTLDVEFLDARVVVRNDIPGTLAWLREMIAPAFAVHDDPAPERRGDTLPFFIEAVERLPGAHCESLGLTPCFALDHDIVRLPAHRDGASVLVDDTFFRARYTIEPHGLGVSQIEPVHHLRGASLRLIREAMLSRVDWTRRVQLHASAVASSGRVVAFAGQRESGKTSLLAHVSRATGAGLVSNDRLVLSRATDGWAARGVPTIVSVRPGTIERLPHLFGSCVVPALVQPVMHTIEELRHTLLMPVGATSTSMMLSLPQLADLAHAPLTPGGRLVCVALVDIDDTVDTFEVRRLSNAQAERRIDAVRFGVSTEPRPTTVVERVVGGRDAPMAPAPPAGLLAQLAAEVACVNVVVGRRLLADEAPAQQLLHELLDVG
jgi:hypothetical protein